MEREKKKKTSFRSVENNVVRPAEKESHKKKKGRSWQKGKNRDLLSEIAKSARPIIQSNWFQRPPQIHRCLKRKETTDQYKDEIKWSERQRFRRLRRDKNWRKIFLSEGALHAKEREICYQNTSSGSKGEEKA